MSSSNKRPVLRARRNAPSTNTDNSERKRKTRTESFADENSNRVAKKKDSKVSVQQDMRLESSESLESNSFNFNSTESSFNTSTNTSNFEFSDTSLSDLGNVDQQQKRRRSARPAGNHANRKPHGNVVTQKQIVASKKQEMKCPLILQHPPQTPTELINGMTSFTFSNYFTPVSKDSSPLPRLPWADSNEVWEIMLQKDRDYKRDSLYIRKHPSLQPRMRAVLLDWLIEVCEVYRLHRETFHLAVDYVDRYLSATKSIAKTRLQLVGITALFVAAKIEEIYPPKLAEFAYVTDGACKDDEILQQEIILLQALNWQLSPVTPLAWLSVFLQIAGSAKSSQVNHTFELPQFSTIHLARVAELIDLCCLDTGYLQFSYSIIAASCLYHVWGKDVTEVTGHKFEELFPCIQWLSPFAKVSQSLPIKPIKQFDKIAHEDAHNIQVHNNGMQMLDLVHATMNTVIPVNNLLRSSPLVTCKGMLTPPQSAEKGGHR